MPNNSKFQRPNVNRDIKSKLESQGNEYGKASKGIIVCNICHDVFFKKGWHKPGSAPITDTRLSGTGVHFSLCPACKMKQEGLFGGKVTIKNIPAETREELYNLISGFGRRALERNPQHRIMDIKTSGGTFVVTTNNDQLALKLGKKINETFKKTELKTSFSSEPQEVSNIIVSFLK